MLVEEILDHRAFQEPVYRRCLECELGVALASESSADIFQEIQRRGYVLDDVSAHHEVWAAGRGLAAVELANEGDAAVVERAGADVRGVEPRPSIVSRRAKAPEKLPLPAPDLHHPLVADPRREQIVD